VEHSFCSVAEYQWVASNNPQAIIGDHEIFQHRHRAINAKVDRHNKRNFRQNHQFYIAQTTT